MAGPTIARMIERAVKVFIFAIEMEEVGIWRMKSRRGTNQPYVLRPWTPTHFWRLSDVEVIDFACRVRCPPSFVLHPASCYDGAGSTQDYVG